MGFNSTKILLGALTSAFIFSGCALYSETRDKQGKSLKDAYSKVDLKGQFEVPRKNRANILAQQLATVDSLEAVRREGLIRAVATGRAEHDTVLAQLNMVSALSGADEILGAPVTGATMTEQLKSRSARSLALATWTAQEANARQIRKEIAARVQIEFTRQALTQPSCIDIQTGAKAKLAVDKWIADQAGTIRGRILEEAFTVLKLKCQELQQVLARQASTKIGGELAKVQDALANEQTAYQNLKARTAAERTAANSALVQRDKAAEKGDSQGVREAAGKVQALLAKIKLAKDVFSIQFISDKEQDALDEFLTTVKDTPEGATPKAGASKAAMAIVLFPDLMKAAQQKMDDIDKVSLAPFVLQKKVSQIAYDAATRDIQTRELRIDLLTQQMELRRQQVDKLVQRDELIATMPPQLLGMPMAEALAAPEQIAAGKHRAFQATIDHKMKVWSSLATYIDQGTRIDGEVAKLGFKLNALESEILLGYSEANVTQWDALIGSNVEQLATYGGAGIKVEQITALINSVTLLWIGAGVH